MLFQMKRSGVDAKGLGPRVTRGAALRAERGRAGMGYTATWTFLTGVDKCLEVIVVG